MSRWIAIALLGATALASAGCLRSQVDARWGRAQEATVARQTADPTAPATAAPVEGMDPASAEVVSERYYRGQREQRTRKSPAVLIGEMP